ncbi:VOC family protein [Lentzea sp. NPDC042327]|uniref:VOC family protein n=1 Tax=Lentzea sp. NPDC042327 TaxID=3154801 RepID=UPI0033D92977
MRIDHLVYAVPDLEAGVDEFERLFGVRAAGGGQHVGMGTHNRLLALGPHTYLELIAPDPAQPEPALPRPFGVDGMTGPGLVGWALATDDIDAARDHAAANGHDPGPVIDGQRRTPEGGLVTWRLTTNALRGGVIPFLISWGTTPSPATTAPQGLELRHFHVEHPDDITPQLRALQADVETAKGPEPALTARISGPGGTHTLSTWSTPEPR